MSTDDRLAGAVAPDASPAAAAPAPTEPEPIFPSIKRNVFDVLHDDERNECWIGIRLRQTQKMQRRDQRTGAVGPVEDVEINIDPMAVLVALDSAKAEVLMVLNKDTQLLNQKRQRQALIAAPVKGVSIGGMMDRLGKTLSGKSH